MAEIKNFPADQEAAKRKNLKAEKLQAYFDANKLNFFQKQELHDETDTVLFRSAVEVEGQRLPVGIITDNTIYTIIRTQVGTGLVKDANKAAFLEYLNTLNRNYKVFKYIAAEDGDVYLDACIPTSQEGFEPEMVRIVLDVIVDHLQENYKEVMKQAWK